MVIKDEWNDDDEVKGKKEVKSEITIDDFDKLDLGVGQIVEAKKHPKADKLLVFKVNVGNEVRQIVSGIAKFYKPEELIGKQVLAVVNFPPRQIANFMSEVLVLGTYSEGGVVLITPDKAIKNGDKLG